MTGKAEDRPSFGQQPPEGGNDPEDKKGLVNRTVNDTHLEGGERSGQTKKPKDK